jgi:ferredoxin-NADP reductase
MPTDVSTGYTTKLNGREQVAEGTMAFYFDKPSGFEFRAGQAIDIILLNPPETDSEGNIRTFSIASPPFENRLMVATRMRDSAFKRVLKGTPLGTAVNIGGPSGSLTLHKNSAKPAVFLAGGIGITPFLSILSQAARDKLAHHLYLFYSNRRPEDAPFLDTLSELQRANPNLRFVPTMTAMDKSQQKWTGETGVIDSRMLARHLASLQGPIYYVAGPPAMVAALRQMLTTAGADEDDIRTEEFSGY